jgi:hypothetical protein
VSTRPVWPSRLALPLFAFSAAAFAYDYPTRDRVQYVEECIQAHPDRSHQEMLYKCSCSIDFIAKEIPYDAYVELQTAAKAISIAGEFGEAVRGAETAKDMAKKYRDAQARAAKSCLIAP